MSFDKSLNEITKDSEMVVMVQHWDEEENEVRTCYLGSTFLGHSTAVDLMDKLNEVIKHLDPKKLYQISMDGPAKNLKFLNEFKLKQEENAFHSKIDIGTCSLHTVHGSVKTAFDKSNMKIKKTLKGGFQLLHNSPARREDYECFRINKVSIVLLCNTLGRK